MTQPAEKRDGGGEGVAIAILFATLSFIPFYLVARIFLKASKGEAIRFSLVLSLAVPVMAFLYGICFIGGIMSHAALTGADLEGGLTAYFRSWEFYVGFLFVYVSISYIYICVLSSPSDKEWQGFQQFVWWLLSGWTAVLLLGIGLLLGYLIEDTTPAPPAQVASVRAPAVEPPTDQKDEEIVVPTESPMKPWSVVQLSNTGLEASLWYSQYETLMAHRRLELRGGSVVWDTAAVRILADYNSYIQALIIITDSETGDGLEVYYEGMSITVLGRRTVNWTARQHREVRLTRSADAL